MKSKQKVISKLKAANTVICEGSHFTHMWQTLARTHGITKTGDVGHKTRLTLPLFIEV
jgi:hypothetical protein